MNLKLFRKIVLVKVEKVIEHIRDSGIRFAQGERKPIEKSKNLETTTMQARLKEFKKIIKASGYNQEKK